MPEKIQKGISYTLVSQIISMGLQFGLSIILARGLGSNAYGLFGIVQNGILTISWILDLGGSIAVTKYISDYEAKRDTERTTSVLATTLVLHALLILVFWAILFAFQSDILRLWFDNDSLLLVLFALSTAALVFISDLIGALYGFRELKYVAIRLLIQNLLIALLSLLFIGYLRMGVRAAVAIYFFVLVIMLLALVWMFRPFLRDGRLGFRFKVRFREIILFSLPIGGLNILEQLMRYAPFLLVKALGSGDPLVNDKIASLSLAVLLSSVAENIIGILNKSGIGYLTHWLTVGKKNVYATFVFLMLVGTALLYGAIAVVVFFGIGFFVSITYGSQYEAISQFMFLTLALSAIRSFSLILRTSLYTLELSRRAFLASLVEFVLYIVILFWVNRFEAAPDWSIRLLQVSFAAGLVKLLILFFNLFRSIRDRFDPPMIELLKEGLKLVAAALPRKARQSTP